MGVGLVRDPPAAVDACDGEVVDEVAAEVIGLDQHGDTGVAREIDAAYVRAIVRTRESRLRLDERGELGDRLIGVHGPDVAEHVGIRMERLTHLVAVAVRAFDVQLDQFPDVGKVLQVLCGHVGTSLVISGTVAGPVELG